jgi:hypothetical protein
LEPVLLRAPPTREIVEVTTVNGVANVKLVDVAGPAEFADMAA